MARVARLARGRASRTARVTAAMRWRHLLGGARPLVFEDRFAHLFVDLPGAVLAMPAPSMPFRARRRPRWTSRRCSRRRACSPPVAASR